LRDPNEINLRYETPEQNEYLLTDLLAPVSAGPLSPVISQGEYASAAEMRYALMETPKISTQG